MKTKTKTQSNYAITSLPPSAADDRHGRMMRYLIAMLIRMVCIILCFPLPGWWKILPAIGAVVLPYVAVVLANVGQDTKGAEVERPGGLQVYRPEAQPSSAFPSGEQATPGGRYAGEGRSTPWASDPGETFPTASGQSTGASRPAPGTARPAGSRPAPAGSRPAPAGARPAPAATRPAAADDSSDIVVHPSEARGDGRQAPIRPIVIHPSDTQPPERGQ
ncbi:DUF3099 domain-containing protein [Frondihabitans cladoniiphilus]|uniref:DUF3099 family protein n=1 Tax=Frondihabitans cladoniiphilus TaxID=715785 RepID=A0ABP8W7A8_9MICO